MSTNSFFQPPAESTGARTIYTVLSARNAFDSTNPSDYSNDSFYDQNDYFNYDHYDHEFHAFITNSPVPSKSSFNGFDGINGSNSSSSFPSGSGSSYAPSRSDGLYKSPKFSPQSKHSRTPSSSSFSSFSSATPSLTFSSSPSLQSSPSSSPSSLSMTDCEAEAYNDNCGYEDNDEDMLFDATDKAQLDAFVPPQLRAAIDAAKYSSFGKFGDEICWEALPPVFDLGHENKEGTHPQHGQFVEIDWQPFDSFPNYPTAAAVMESVTPPPTASNSKSLASEFPPLSELLPEQQEKLCAFLYKHRDCVASIEQIREIADATNLTITAIVYYLCFY